MGSKIEEKLALGFITAEVIVDLENDDFPEMLRDEGFGVTSWLGEGRDGKRLIMLVPAKRNRQRKLIRLVDKACPNAFIFFEEPKYFRGGFGASKLWCK